MSMRVSTLVTYLRPEDAYALIETLDHLRDALMRTYGDDIRALLQEASSPQPRDTHDEEPF